MRANQLLKIGVLFLGFLLSLNGFAQSDEAETDGSAIAIIDNLFKILQHFFITSMHHFSCNYFLDDWSYLNYPETIIFTDEIFWIICVATLSLDNHSY